MTQRLAEQAAERHVVALLDEPVPVPVPQVGRTVTVRRSGDKPDVGSFTMSMTLLQQKQEASPCSPREHRRTTKEPPWVVAGQLDCTAIGL